MSDDCSPVERGEL